MNPPIEIMITGSLVAITCAILGCFLILRQMAMVGDAISHAVLPGIVIAYLITGSRDSIPMLMGAATLGILTTFLIELFHKKARLQADASIGITFTWLFALGVILISAFTEVDLDQDCVLYGEINYISLDRILLDNGLDLGPRAIWIMGGVFLLILGFLIIGYKELFLTTFDPAFALAIGISTTLWHYLLMGAVSMTTVAAFDSVGAILVVAFLIGPPATAYLLTNDLKVMLILASGLGVLSAVVGYFVASYIDGSIAGAMSVVVGVEFLLAMLFSPTQGILTKKWTKLEKIEKTGG